MDQPKYDESKYIQQHLANERTFLAWLRTGIAIIGIGFLAVTLHLNYGPLVSEVTDRLSVWMMVTSLIVGLGVLLTGMLSYFQKRKAINESSFRSSGGMILLVTSAVSLLVILLAFYFLLIL
ncbi:YidH family protein [Bacillus thermotolerans]|uniref:DUF202 domain-containing protein n=1 Tax=Bacillus thermotolerans TaxID=1221996 RepID=A0A0F5I5V5_BACTR|nr:DUF202 domain-containing protein [Bacillus thermotolerans]KKB39897.1 hypothetical protein QY96_02684 [Bacillus thermotolerans]KKB40853.1 hypothetical protein QY95_01165 [Bacillus thermotolerans]